jgi:hypothetical protein
LERQQRWNVSLVRERQMSTIPFRPLDMRVIN